MQMADKATQIQKVEVLIIRSDMFEAQVKNREEWQSTSPNVKPRDLPTLQRPTKAERSTSREQANA